jgi:hypothetical protein
VATYAGVLHLRFLWRSVEKNLQLRLITVDFTVAAISYVYSLCGDFCDFQLPSLVRDDYREAGKQSFPDKQTHLTQCTE